MEAAAEGVGASKRLGFCCCCWCWCCVPGEDDARGVLPPSGGKLMLLLGGGGTLGVEVLALHPQLAAVQPAAAGASQ